KKKSLEGKIGGDEPYYLSDEAASFETDPDDVDDEGEGEVQQKVKARRRKIKRRVIFDKTCKKIASVRDFREAVTKYVVQQKVSIEKYVNEPTKVRVKFKKASCSWLLVASYDSRTKDFVVKNYNPVHKCDPTNRNKLCNSKFLAKRFNERIKEQPNIRIFKFQELIRKKLGLYVGRTVCRRAKNIMLNEIMGDHKLEYGRILDYRDWLLRSNPGSTYIVKLSEETFEGHALDWMEGVCRGQLLVAVCKDGNNQMLLLAWAGLENAIADLLPNSEHRMCARHILANWSKKWRGIKRRNCFWRCARSTYEWELKKNLDDMKKLTTKIVDALLYYNIERWSKVYFNIFYKSDSVDNNMAECFNAWIMAAR
uniref:Transposase MuDR plant domain-containing protein n=1 Tax=Nicotiana tabacum TaxID=4097 RepID=A0A1S3ZQM4_TOBAC